jgi:hypothetical protein
MKRISAVLAVFFAAVLLVQAQNYPPPPPQGQQPWVYGPQSNWTPDWNRRPDPQRGACFYNTAPFRGNHFCVRSGDRLPSLPGNFGGNISSIQVFGGAQVRIFNDRGFRGGSSLVSGTIPDLRQLPFRGGHTWNNRISSIVVR